MAVFTRFPSNIEAVKEKNPDLERLESRLLSEICRPVPFVHAPLAENMQLMNGLLIASLMT